MHKNNRSILFVCPYPLNVAPSQRFRFEQYFEILGANGIHFKVSPFLGHAGWSVLYHRGKFFQKLFFIMWGYIQRIGLFYRSIPQADIIFIHREAAPLGPPIFEWVIAKVLRKKIIYDFDDAIWLPNTSEENKYAAWIKWHTKIKSICKWSYRISGGNKYLVDFAGRYNQRVVLNPTTVDTINGHNPALHMPKEESGIITVGWTGSHSNLHYLAPLLPVFESLSKQFSNLRFLVIANKKPTWDLHYLDFIAWDKENEISDLMQIDIGIMPLPDDEWAKGKCGFKILQYFSLEKPAVASRVGVNSSIIDQGVNGYLCTGQDEWLHHLAYLINHPGQRRIMGKNGREKIDQEYSVNSNTVNFLRLFESDESVNSSGEKSI